MNGIRSSVSSSVYAFGGTLFNLTVSPGLLGLGIGWALAVAVLGGLA
jgi:hypothetical protein